MDDGEGSKQFSDDLQRSMDRLTDEIRNLVKIFTTASADINAEAEAATNKKLDVLLDQNQEMAKALLALIKLQKEQLDAVYSIATSRSEHGERPHRREHPSLARESSQRPVQAYALPQPQLKTQPQLNVQSNVQLRVQPQPSVQARAQPRIQTVQPVSPRPVVAAVPVPSGPASQSVRPESSVQRPLPQETQFPGVRSVPLQPLSQSSFKPVEPSTVSFKPVVSEHVSFGTEPSKPVFPASAPVFRPQGGVEFEAVPSLKPSIDLGQQLMSVPAFNEPQAQPAMAQDAAFPMDLPEFPELAPAKDSSQRDRRFPGLGP